MSHLSRALPKIWDIFQLPNFISRERKLVPAQSPTLGLPPETLLEIFQWAVAQCDGDMSKDSAPINISQTCRYWRHLVLASERLWTRFQTDGSLAPLWFERAGRSLLEVIHKCNYPSDGARSAKGNWHEALAGKQRQWKAMVMEYDPRVNVQPAATLHDLSNLMGWHIKHREPFAVTDGSSFNTMGSPTPLFLVSPFDSTTGPIAPRLTILHVDIGIIDESGYYGLDNRGLLGLMTMLQHSPSVRILSLGIDVSSEAEAEPESWPSIRLLHLEEFTLYGPEAAFLLLPRITAPATTRLGLLANEQCDLTAVPKALKSFLQNAGTSKLKTVDIDFGEYNIDSELLEFDEEDHFAILEALPDVRDLTLSLPCGDLTCRLLELPRGPDAGDAPGFCPELTCLSMTLKSGTDISAMRSLLSSRFDRSEDFTAILHIQDLGWRERKAINKERYFVEWHSKGRLQFST